MGKLDTRKLKISGAALVVTKAYEDDRGSFKRLFCERELSEYLDDKHIVNVNLSITHSMGMIRGLHFQMPPSAELKIVQCVKGVIWDVMVDLRKESPTFLSWIGVELSAENNSMVIIPEGVAHGFQALKDNCELLYMHTAYYDKTMERGLRYDDPALKVDWPLPVTQCSEKDCSFPYINKDTYKGVG